MWVSNDRVIRRTLLIQISRAVERALITLAAGKPMRARNGVNLEVFKEIVGMQGWQQIETTFGPRER